MAIFTSFLGHGERPDLCPSPISPPLGRNLPIAGQKYSHCWVEIFPPFQLGKPRKEGDWSPEINNWPSRRTNSDLTVKPIRSWKSPVRDSLEEGGVTRKPWVQRPVKARRTQFFSKTAGWAEEATWGEKTWLVLESFWPRHNCPWLHSVTQVLMFPD